jgi:hypothetical protein
MAVIIYPSNPSVGQLYRSPQNVALYEYDGIKWNLIGQNLNDLSASTIYNVTVFTGSALLQATASNWNFTGSGVNVARSGSDGVLVTIAGGGGGATPNLQAVTSIGNITSQSIDIYVNNMFGPAPNTTGSSTLTNGWVVEARGDYSHAEGEATTAIGVGSHTEGVSTTAVGDYSHVEGGTNITIGVGSHAEGIQTTAIGTYSHAEGEVTTAIGVASHAEGGSNQAVGNYSHAEGYNNTASGSYSHAEGEGSVALGVSSHTEGLGTIASGSYQHVQGQWNIPFATTASFIIGNGVDNDNRNNSLEVYDNIIRMPSLPTSSLGLPSGSIWVDTSSGNILKRV